MQRILALIPARAGSKRLPNKNKRLFFGKPLIQWTILLAKRNSYLCDVLVSTDDEDVILLAEQADVLAPWKRPASLATDSASSADVAIHALDWYEENIGDVDGLVLLQPTSPLRKPTTLAAGIDLFQKSAGASVIGVSKAHIHKNWIFEIKNQYLNHLNIGKSSKSKSDIFVPNGLLYVASPTTLRREKSFFSDECVPLISTDEFEDVDIDTYIDFIFAEYLKTTILEA